MPHDLRNSSGSTTAEAGPGGAPRGRRLPPWIKVTLGSGSAKRHLSGVLRARGLHTVCEEARCPNIHECWGGGTATFMLLGDVCTRACRFCSVASGRPEALDVEEPAKVVEAAAILGLRYVVLTSVDRDDLPDQGASGFAATVRALKAWRQDVLVEALIPDFRGEDAPLAAVLESRPDVLAHNIETVERLQRVVRDVRAGYRQSLGVLERAKRLSPPARVTKSSIMLGLGETSDEVVETLRDLRAAGADAVTLGQYLQPTPRHRAVSEFVAPERFLALRARALEMGFLYVAAGPLVRSSYRAGEYFLESILRGEASRGQAR